ncbi:MAG: response regulator [Propionibacteriales bacterium]|nr:response regulator [Propionibacteriales bacterium]
MRLVISDDHRLLLEAMATSLARHGFIIEAATTTPADAVRAVALHDPDLLLSDVSFPQGSGLDAAREVVEHHRRTKVVLVTGMDTLEPLIEALEIGVSGYTRKDQRIEGIASVLETAARGEIAIDQGLLRRLTRRGQAEPAGPRSPLDFLTPREKHVLALLIDGMSTSEIVRAIGVSHSTARTHVQSILSKLGVHSRLQAVALLSDEIAQGLLDNARTSAPNTTSPVGTG